MKLKAKKARDDVKEKVDFNNNYEKELESKIKDLEVEHRNDLETKNIKFQKQKEFEKELKEKTVKKNPYASRVTEASRKKREKKADKGAFGILGTAQFQDDFDLPPDNYLPGIQQDILSEDDRIDIQKDKFQAELFQES